ncbi:hypothetical protein PV326_007752 [Microctonus aethiopoides]|uniref:NADH dehydrogenase [ubiquinone] 1 beta subcomplex subunit 6 n=1 Tax=Microctonus aethiopoides TaxID=144406 RepID=A0AA39KTK7_9HYME|nr:hypothetical protein PV326_007752 [Microctonus aethiopoides]KAK0173126.1 hypothetical protein PV328_006369 [Microctonus aethiopoides]
MSEGKASQTGGVQPMSIAGRMVSERERLLGMSPEERAWRAQWLKDQHLAPDEPKINPEYYRIRYNPIRRFYRAPLDKLENALLPKYGPNVAYFWRHLISKTFFIFVGITWATYYFKYKASDWTRLSGLKVTKSRPILLPGDPGYPNFYRKKDNEYATHGFENSPI